MYVPKKMYTLNVLFLVTLVASACWAKPAEVSDPLEESGEFVSPDPEVATSELQKEYDGVCLRYSGGNVTYTKIEEAVKNTYDCYHSKLDVDKLQKGWNKLSNKTRVKYFTKYCPSVRSTTVDCFRPVELLSMRCVRPGGQRIESPDFPLYFFPQMIDLVCDGHGKILFAYNIKKAKKCFDNYFIYFLECTKNFGSRTNAKLRQNYSEVECKVMQEARDCVLEKLTSCGTPDLIQLFDIPYGAFVRETPCRNYI